MAGTRARIELTVYTRDGHLVHLERQFEGNLRFAGRHSEHFLSTRFRAHGAANSSRGDRPFFFLSLPRALSSSDSFSAFAFFGPAGVMASANE